MYDVAIAGGGVIGLAAARTLARSGLRVVLLERGAPGGSASWAAAGMLSPLAEADRADHFLDLLRASRQIYPSFVRELEEESGCRVGYRDEGTMLVALERDDEEELRARYEWQRAAGLPVEWLSGTESRELEPALAAGARAALYFAEDHQVDNRLLAGALEIAAERAGVEVRSGEVLGISREGERATGVILASGQRVAAEWVVIATGAWTSEIQGLPRDIPVRPVHGELLALAPPRTVLRHVVDSPRVYLVPRLDGRVIVGATMEEIGFERRVSAGGLHRLLAAALELLPALGKAPVVETWSGLRPGTPDGKPILGADPEITNLIYATGHYRNGILLTPVTAAIVGEVIIEGRSRHDLQHFSPERFLSE